jgi:hypothetical protein
MIARQHHFQETARISQQRSIACLPLIATMVRCLTPWLSGVGMTSAAYNFSTNGPRQDKPNIVSRTECCAVMQIVIQVDDIITRMLQILPQSVSELECCCCGCPQGPMVAPAAPHGTDGHSAGHAVQPKLPDSRLETDLLGRSKRVVGKVRTEECVHYYTYAPCLDVLQAYLALESSTMRALFVIVLDYNHCISATT